MTSEKKLPSYDAVLTGIWVSFIGLAVMLGWHFRLTGWLQIFPSSPAMQYNTALCFLISGMALSATGAGRPHLAFPLGLLLLLISGLTVLEYGVGKNLGIDQIFLKPHITTYVFYPGRMSPITAVCFLFLSAAFVLISRSKNQKPSIIGITFLCVPVLFLAAVVLIGYSFKLEAAYGWASYTRMAIPTAGTFIFLSGGMIFWTWKGERGWFWAAILLVLGMFVSVTVFTMMMQRYQHDLSVNFKNDSANRAAAIRREIEGGIRAVQAMRAFFDGSKEVDRQEFREFAMAIIQNRPSVQAFEWVPLVTAAGRPDFVNRVRAEGFPSYDLWIVNDAGNRQAVPPEQEVSFPIDYAEPFEKNSDILGLDYGFQADWREAFFKAGRLNTNVATAATRLFRRFAKGEVGVILAEPIFKKQTEQASSEKKEQEVQGYVTVVLVLPRLVQTAFNYLDARGDVNVYVYEKKPTGDLDLVYFQPPRDAPSVRGSLSEKELSATETLSYEEVITFSEREWVIRCYPPLMYLQQYTSFAPWIVLGVGILLTVLLAGYVYTINQSRLILRRLNSQLHEEITAREKIQKALENANEELAKKEQLYRSIFENSAVAITMTDDQERIIAWNRFAENMLGMTREDLNLKPVKDLYPDEEWKKIRSLNVRQKGSQHRIDTHIIRKDGSIIPVDIAVSVLTSSDGTITGSIG
ncbi:MAG TPA: CHASE domain-containing protein, partial [Verrucomicrobiae bacterium]|nr:CHASE domain-containing protein [Verrucomicrobiae bacterium]